MRKGDAERPWTTSEERFLMESAGVLTRREICRKLKRSRASVEQKALRLRRNGMEVSLRVYRRPVRICPRCGKARSRFDQRIGWCRACVAEGALDEAMLRQSEAYRMLTAADKARYSEQESRTESAMPPRPAAPRTDGMGALAKQRALDMHAIDVEVWEEACTRRRTNAAKKRTQRMREKTGTNPRKNFQNE